MTEVESITVDHHIVDCVPLQKLIAGYCGTFEDVSSRPIIVTEIKACYGATSHVVISVEGSPPRGTIIFDSEGGAFLICQDECWRLANKKYDIVRKFFSDLGLGNAKGGDLV